MTAESSRRRFTDSVQGKPTITGLSFRTTGEAFGLLTAILQGRG